MTPRKIDPTKPKLSRGHPRKYTGGLVQKALWLLPDQWNKLVRVAAQRGTTASAIMRELIDNLQEEGEG